MITPGFIYLSGSLILFFTKIKTNIRYVVTLLISLLALIFSLYLTSGMQWQVSFLNYNLIPLKVDSINKMVAVIFTIAGLTSIIYTINLSSKRYLQLVCFFVGSALTVVLAGDLFTLYVFWELMTISSSMIIITSGTFAKRAGYYYFLIHLFGGLSLLWGIFLQFSQTGSLALNNISAGIPFFMIGVGIKLAFIGFHTWLPATYSKVPFYVSVLLSIYTTKVGVYVMYRLLPGISFLAYAGLFSALVGIIMALRQKNSRRLLSYSIITQVGYMIMGISTGTVIGFAGAFFHLFNHILYKTVLFMVIGIIIFTTGKENLKELRGVGRRLPVTTGAAVISLLSVAGVPFVNGYLSKSIIKEALNEPILVWGLYLIGIGTTLVFLKFVSNIFYIKEEGSQTQIFRKPTKGMLLAIILLSLLMALIGINPAILEGMLEFEIDINYFDLSKVISGIQPFIWGFLIFVIFHSYFNKDFSSYINLDIYKKAGKLFNQTGKKLSKYHTGNLSDYLLWAITALIFIWIKINYI